MLDAGALQSDEPNLARTARRPVALMSANTARDSQIGDYVKIIGRTGEMVLETAVIEMPDGVVWVPQNSAGSQIALIGSAAGDIVSIQATEVTK